LHVPRPDLGPKPRLGYAASSIERASERRADATALAALENDRDARAYLLAGEFGDPQEDCRHSRSPVYIGRSAHTRSHRGNRLSRTVPERASIRDRARAGGRESLKTREEFVITDLRSIAIRGLVETYHLPPLAEGKALLSWHARHRFCSTCGAATDLVEGGWRRDCPRAGRSISPARIRS